MEEQKIQKKKKQLYVIIGALLLVIALVGGTYAYFSASVSNTNTIGGNTQNINNNSLTLTVKKVVFNGTSAPSNDLVPAYFGTCGSGDVSTYGCTVDGLKVIDPAHLKVAQVSSMLTHKCEQDGFTGCHVYQIKINADQNITHANLLLNLSLSDLTGASNIENKNQWGYVVFQADGTVDSSTGATSGLTNPVLNANNGAPAAIGNGVTNLDIHNDSTLSSTVVTYYLLVYLNDTDASQNNVVSNSGDANYAVGTYSGTLELQALGGKVRACFTPTGACEVEPQETAAQYITSLYTDYADKTTKEIYEITYNLAPIYDNDEDDDTSGGLIDDRFASSSTPVNTVGNIRYYGGNPNNYVWLGDTYIEDNQTIKKLWRIIGVFDGKLKLIQNDYLYSPYWDISDGGDGNGINQWGPSGNYEGADLMILLNDEFGPYWTKGYDSFHDRSYENTGLSASEKSMIDTATWYLGASEEQYPYDPAAQYNAERQSSILGNSLCPDCDEVTRTATWTGKVGLIYPSDYLYVGYPADWNDFWMRYIGATISPFAGPDSANLIYIVTEGDLGIAYTDLSDDYLQPVVYLRSNVIISDGDGTYDNPYELSLS